MLKIITLDDHQQDLAFTPANVCVMCNFYMLMSKGSMCVGSFIQQSACLSFLLLVINATQLREQKREVVCIVFAESTALQKCVLLGQPERVNIN